MVFPPEVTTTRVGTIRVHGGKVEAVATCGGVLGDGMLGDGASIEKELMSLPA